MELKMAIPEFLLAPTKEEIFSEKSKSKISSSSKKCEMSFRIGSEEIDLNNLKGNGMKILGRMLRLANLER